MELEMGRQRLDGERLQELLGMASEPHLCAPKSLFAIPIPDVLYGGTDNAVQVSGVLWLFSML